MTDDFINNENRARLRDSINKPTPCNADGGVAGNVRGAGPNDLPPPLRDDAPMMTDPHAAGRNSFDNMERKPPERPRSHYAAEDRRRLRPGSGDTYK